MFKDPYMVIKRCVWNKTFLLGHIVWNKDHFMLHFTTFGITHTGEMTTKASNVIIIIIIYN